MIRISFAALLLAGTAHAQDAPPAVLTEARQLPGLQAPGEIIIDRAGIPHIYAANAREYNARRGWTIVKYASLGYLIFWLIMMLPLIISVFTDGV